MAIYFNFAANCGKDEGSAQNFLNYFKNKKLILSNNRKVPLDCYLQKNEEDGIVGIDPAGMHYGMDTTDVSLLKEPYNLEIKKFFYDHLVQAPSFEFAAFGREIVDYLSSTKKEDIFNSIAIPQQLKDFVITTSLWEQIGSPQEFILFRDGYYWYKNLENFN